jgi:hypothetical protein
MSSPSFSGGKSSSASGGKEFMGTIRVQLFQGLPWGGFLQIFPFGGRLSVMGDNFNNLRPFATPQAWRTWAGVEFNVYRELATGRYSYHYKTPFQMLVGITEGIFGNFRFNIPGERLRLPAPEITPTSDGLRVRVDTGGYFGRLSLSGFLGTGGAAFSAAGLAALALAALRPASSTGALAQRLIRRYGSGLALTVGIAPIPSAMLLAYSMVYPPNAGVTCSFAWPQNLPQALPSGLGIVAQRRAAIEAQTSRSNQPPVINISELWATSWPVTIIRVTYRDREGRDWGYEFVNNVAPPHIYPRFLDWNRLLGLGRQRVIFRPADLIRLRLLDKLDKNDKQ